MVQPKKRYKVCNVIQEGNCFFLSLSILIYKNENDYKKIKYAAKNKIIELYKVQDKEFMELYNLIEYIDNRKKINEIIEFDPEKYQWASLLLLTEITLNANIITITLKKNNNENIYIFIEIIKSQFKPLQKTFVVWNQLRKWYQKFKNGTLILKKW